MKVRLISKTAGVIPDLVGRSLGDIIAYVARVSNPGNQANHLTSPKLLSYCLKNNHVSIFEQASFCVEVETSLAIAAQVLRHSSLKFQQWSLRYSESQKSYEHTEARRQDHKNRQNSIDDMAEVDKEWWVTTQKEVNLLCQKFYAEALDKGICKEQARLLLTSGTTTKMYITGSVRSWIHYCKIRTKPDVQREHRDVANECLKVLLGEVPELSDYFEES